MNVEERILLERISSLNQLSDAQRREAEADAYLLELIADNALLADSAAVHAPEPGRAALLDRIEQLAGEKEQTTMGLMGLLSGRSFRAQAAIVCTLLLAVLVVSQLLPGRDMQPGASPAWASSDGYTIVYELAGLPAFSTSESGLNTAIDEWRAEVGSTAEKIAMRVRSDGQQTRVALTTNNVNEKQVDRLVQIIADRTGMQDPQVTGTTLFEPAGRGPTDFLSGNRTAHYYYREEPSLERIAGLFAGEAQPSTFGAVVHGGGGQIFLGRFSEDEHAAQDLGSLFPRERIASVADGEYTTFGTLALFGDDHNFAVAGAPGVARFQFHGDSHENSFAVAEGFPLPEHGDAPAVWHGIEEGNTAIAEFFPGASTGAEAPGVAVAWVGSDSGAPAAWVAGDDNGCVSWTPAPPFTNHDIASGFWSQAPKPSRFVVLDDEEPRWPAPLPGVDAPAGFTVWTPQPDSEAGCSFQVLERSQGNNELLPGYTIFGKPDGVRVFSFPPGAQARDIQSRLDEWYEKNGRRISLNVNLAHPLDDELVLIVAEGMESDQSLIILGRDADGVARIRTTEKGDVEKPEDAPEGEQSDAKPSKPAAKPKDK
ncbi:hypothetical protein KDL29_15630 [bacterium]|nr:hypothetical protein [bacterium]